MSTAAATMTVAGRRQARIEALRALRAAGVNAGDRVGILSRNCAECFELLFACSKIGAIYTGINWRLSLANLVPRDAQVTSQAVYADPSTGHTLVTDNWTRNTTFRVVSLRADLRF